MMTRALLRIVYASRARDASDAPARAADLQAILGAARRHNAAHDITGLLIVANAHFVQVLEGPFDEVEALYRKIGSDARHTEMSLLSRSETSSRSFDAWSMGLVERSETEEATAARLQLLRDRLAADPKASAADFCRLMLAPSVNPAPALPRRTAARAEPIASVAFAGRKGLWNAAVLQHVASAAMRPAGRTSVIDPEDAAQRAMVEYIDVELSGIGPLRALSIAAEPGAFAPIAPLMERLSLLVFMMAPSDAEGFIAYARAWLDLPQVRAAAPRVLVMAGASPEQVSGMLQTLRAGTALSLDFVSVKLSDSAAVWRAAQAPFLGQVGHGRAAGRPLPVPGNGRPTPIDADRRASELANGSPPVAHSRDVAEAPSTRDAVPIDDVAELVAGSGCLQELLALDGAIAAALVDAERCAVLLSVDHPDAAPRSFEADAEFLRGKWRLSRALRIADSIEDIAVTTQRAQALYRALPRRPDLFLALIFERECAPLAVVRMRLQEIVGALALLPI